MREENKEAKLTIPKCLIPVFFHEQFRDCERPKLVHAAALLHSGEDPGCLKFRIGLNICVHN